ncbi:MAG TPA: hypothetical protein VFY22_05175 [Hydrogenophaga sp.]|nr:hypothetical protein [Hydrogenophaga sp.]
MRTLPVRIAIATVILALQSCSVLPSDESAYNKGVEAYRAKDYTSARQHWAMALPLGHSSAENNLGYLLYYGLGGDAEQERAVALWRKAAFAGHSEAQWHLGHAYQDGTAVQQSNVEAFAWYRCAAANADAADIDKSVEQAIANDARKSLERLLGKLTKEEFESGEALAKQYIGQYAGGGRGP